MPNTIGKNIKSRREELGITQEELANKLGYKSKSTINKIEKEINDITQSKIIAFAKALETTPANLMGWEEFEKEVMFTKEELKKIYSDNSGAKKRNLERLNPREKIPTQDGYDRLKIILPDDFVAKLPETVEEYNKNIDNWVLATAQIDEGLENALLARFNKLDRNNKIQLIDYADSLSNKK